MNENLLNESIIRKDILKSLNEAVAEEPQRNKRPEGVSEWTFADWFGRDLTGETYDGDIDCSFNKLTSLKGAPKIINGNFKINVNKLTSLKGAPKEIKGNLNCMNNYLTSLDGIPEKIGGGIWCSSNCLTSLEGAPEEVKGDFWCGHNWITSLNGAPKIVNGSFGCSFNELTSLEGAPEKVGGDFECSYDRLTSLEGAPKEVSGSFDCSYNKLTSLKGAPEKVGGDFDCQSNKLISLENTPEIGGDFKHDKIEKEKKKIVKKISISKEELKQWSVDYTLIGDDYFDEDGEYTINVIMDTDHLNKITAESFDEYCDENGINYNDNFHAIPVASDDYRIGIQLYAELKSPGKLSYNKIEIKNALKTIVENYGLIKSWMDDKGIKLRSNKCLLYVFDFNQH